MILSQKKVVNIFPSSIQLGNIGKILNNSCRDTIKYIPARDLLINRLYFCLPNESKYFCLTTDCGKSGPAKHRTQVDSNFEQFCYFYQNKTDYLINLMKYYLKAI